MRMRFSQSSLGIVTVLAIIMVAILSSAASAQMPEIVVDIGDSTYFAEQDTGMLIVRFSNYLDTIAGLALWFNLSNPDVVEFAVSLDTVFDTTYWQCIQYSGPDCIDSLEVSQSDDWDFLHADTIVDDASLFDTTGTLLSGWQGVWFEPVGSGPYESKLVAIANSPSPPYIPGIAPQDNGVLIKIPLVIKDWNEFLAHEVDVFIPPTTQGAQFSDPKGNSLGLSPVVIQDTTFFRCLQWVGDQCIDWEIVSTPPYDSLEVVTDTVLVLDTNKVILNSGFVQVQPPLDCLPGDVNGDGTYGISDLTFLHTFIHFGEPPLPAPWNADVNGDCCISWDDLIILRDGLPIVPCECPNPVWRCCMGMRGNVDYDETDAVNVQDLTRLVEYLFAGGDELFCPEEADVEINGGPGLNIGDLTRLTDYLFGSGSPLTQCDDD